MRLRFEEYPNIHFPYSFFEAMGPAQLPVTPVPVVTSMMVSGGGETARLDLTGHQFSTHLTVWFGDQEAETIFR